MQTLLIRNFQFLTQIFILIAFVLCCAIFVNAAPANFNRKNSDVEQVELTQVFNSLLNQIKTEERPPAFLWQPILIGPGTAAISRYNNMVRELKMSSDFIIDVDQTVNALAFYFPYSALENAGFIDSDRRNRPARRTDKVPVVVMAPGIVELLKNDAGKLDHDRTAFLLGHELAHILKKHINQELLFNAQGLLISRDNELEADAKGMELALKAGFSKDNGLKFYQAMDERLEYCSIEGQKMTHPAFKDRLAALDQKQRELWRAMSAFSNGVFFLTIEHYDQAINYFDGVVSEFPDSYEAWNNLGYAQLMKYCDALVEEDLNSLKIGQIVAGSFYARPDSLKAKVKAFDQELWNRAVISLQRGITKAKEQKIDLLLGKANMALAYLVKPNRKDADLKEARKLFYEAYSSDLFAKESFVSRSAVLINASVADLAENDPASVLKKLNQVRDEYQIRSEQGTLATDERFGAITDSIISAECFNRILAEVSLAKDEESKKKATEPTCECLQKLPPSSYWRGVYQKITGVNQQLNSDIQCSLSTPSIRMITAVQAGRDLTLALGDKIPDLLKLFRSKKSSFEVTGRQPQKIKVPSFGFEIIGESDVLAIVLNDSRRSPALKIHHRNLGGQTPLKVGYSRKRVEELLGPAGGLSALFYEQQNQKYFFYPYTGLSIRYDLNDKVAELIVVQAPRLNN